jgi:pyruvate,orthophosphate dikinase
MAAEDEIWARTIACGPPASDSPSPKAVGNKAANLLLMAEAGLPVPPGFVITTAACREYFARGNRLPESLQALIARNIEHIERATGLRFGGRRRPLLLSIRSSAPVSMPGMMDTILNIGLCDHVVSPLVRMTGNPRFVWDSFRRLLQAYSEVVRHLPPNAFDRLFDEYLQRHAVRTRSELDVFALRDLTQQFLSLYANLAGEPFPQEPLVQLASATEAVIRSWNSARAIEYRRLNGIDDDIGVAVTVQAMVFGNLGNTSGSGVGFTRDPTNGKKELYVDFLWNTQGEDVVSGRHVVKDGTAIGRVMPALNLQLRKICGDLERLFRDVQDFEFTIQEGQLYLLQSRTAKCTPWAALQIACDLVKEGLIDEQTALERLRDYDLNSLERVRLASEQQASPLSIGVAACPGVAVGQIALDPQVAVAIAREGRRPILVRHDISTDDVAGLAVSEGILTMLGGRTSHAAVVARQMNKVCVVGCRGLVIENDQRCRIGAESFSKGDFLTLDGHSGAVYSGKLEVIVEKPTELLSVVERWQRSR